VLRDVPVQERRARAPARSREEWMADIANDPEGVWRSPWLARCARHAAGR
jgi:hypothetical protein